MQFVEYALAVVQARHVHRTPARWEDARPGDGHAERPHTQVLQQLNVFLVAVVEVIGHVARIAVVGLARHVRENIPDGRPAPILPCSAFSLIRGRCASPQKSPWKGALLRKRFSFREPRHPNTGKRSRSPSGYPELT